MKVRLFEQCTSIVVVCHILYDSVPKKHAQGTSNKKLSTSLHKIAESLHCKQQLDQALVATIDPIEQNNLFDKLNTNLQRCLLANLASKSSSYIIKFNNNVKFVPSEIWNLYLRIYLKQFLINVQKENARRQRMHKPRVKIQEFYLPPTQCKLEGQSWARNKMRITHEGIIILVSEYMYSFTPKDPKNELNLCTIDDRYDWIDLVVKGLGDKYKDKLTENQQNQAQNMHAQMNEIDESLNIKSQRYQQAKHKVESGQIILRSRTFTTINISRRSAADCALRENDFITSWFRFGSDIKSKTYVSGRIIGIFQIENLHLLMPFLPTHLFPYNVFILLDLFKPYDVKDWDRSTWYVDPKTGAEPENKNEFGM